MNKQIKAVALAAGFLAMTLHGQFVFAEEKGKPDEAVAMVKKAVAYYKENGKDKAFAEIANTANIQFHDRDLYVFVYDMNGVNVAHGNNPKMVGKNLIDLKDVNGTPIIRGFIDVVNTKGKGWFDYQWPNPVTKSVDTKSGYVEKTDNLIFGSGIYK